MNQYQQNMFDQAEALVASSDTFYGQDFDCHGTKFRIYNYRLASYTEFLKPGALEMRGHMFELNADGSMKRLAALCMQKFFNAFENPLTMDLDFSKVDSVELKADGSLMSTFVHMGELYFKSKGSLYSDQALDANKWIRLPENEKFHRVLKALTEGIWTINLEWCAPHNRIVIGYSKAHLKVLNARSREDGSYMPRQTLVDVFGRDNVIEAVDTNGLNTKEFIESIPKMTDDIEGYVARIGDLWFKIKTEKYMSLHHAKDSINNPRRLFESILDEGIDDLRSMFAHDEVAIQTINTMEGRVVTLYNSMVAEVDSFYEANKELSQKDYAIKGQQEVTRMYFGLAMAKFTGKPVDYRSFLKSKYKELGFRDTSLDKKDAE